MLEWWHDVTHKHFTLTHESDNIWIEFCYTRLTDRIKGIGVIIDNKVSLLEGVDAERFLIHLGTAAERKGGWNRGSLMTMLHHVQENIPCGVCS